VQWSEITVVSLHLDDRIKDVKLDTPVRIDVNGDLPVGMLPRDLPQLAYLLFVHIDMYYVFIFGLLKRSQFEEIINSEGYATYKHINRFVWERTESYEFPLDAGYYEDPAHFDFEREQQHLVADVFFGRIAKIRDKELGLPYELELMRLGFLYTSLLVSVGSDMIKLFEAAELELLWDRLRALTNHLDRARFASGWFPGLLEVITPEEPRFALKNQHTSPNSLYTQVFRFYRQHWKTDDPCVLYEGDVQYLTELMLPQCPLCGRWDCTRLPVSNGRITFGHMELSQFLTNRFHKQLNVDTSWANSIAGTIFADQFWFSENPQRELALNFKRVGERPEARKQSLNNMIAMAQRALDQLSETERWMVMEFGQSYIAEIRECMEDLLPKPRNNHHVQVAFEGVEDAIPQSREELIQYAERYWPPCLVAYVKSCQGFKHLKHPDRRKVSAMLKLFGYPLDAAQQMFWLMFSDTRVEALTGKSEFLVGKRGSIIANDFGNGKNTNLGVSCRALIGAGQCPFSGNVDMEDIARTGCSTHMNELRVAEGKLSRELFPIASPRSYFVQRRKE
jgi:hypothetical protein